MFKKSVLPLTFNIIRVTYSFSPMIIQLFANEK